MRNETLPLLRNVAFDDGSDGNSQLHGNRPPASPSTLHEIAVHRSRKRTLEKGFDARGSFVHFAHRSLKSIVQFQDVLERPGVRSFLYRAKWFRRPSILRLRSFMMGSFVTCCSFISLLIALFCSDCYAFLEARGSIVNLSLLEQLTPDRARNLMSSHVFTCVTLALRQCSAAQANDSTQADLLLSIAFVFFIVEFFGNALSDKLEPQGGFARICLPPVLWDISRTYLLSFFFFMDFLGTFSFIPHA